MGVEQIAARRVPRRPATTSGAGPTGVASKRACRRGVDLELEALVEILEGKRLIHCHCYRQDEILAFLRVCEEFDVRVGTLQHILEGYKVADVIAKHGAGGSSFSDWWAYKFEVYDAIPYNGALMHDAGVRRVVQLRRRRTRPPPEPRSGQGREVRRRRRRNEALKFVTLNPAKQLRIDAARRLARSWAKTPTWSSGAARRSRRCSRASRPGSTAASTSTATTTACCGTGRPTCGPP